MVASFWALLSCGAAVKPVRSTLATAAVALIEVDQLVADRYEAAANTNLAIAQNLVEYKSLMEKWDKAEEALRMSRQALLFADHSVAAFDAGEFEGVHAVACALVALEELVPLLEAVNVEVPRAIKDAIKFLRSIQVEACYERT